jgi:hypothetical protein
MYFTNIDWNDIFKAIIDDSLSVPQVARLFSASVWNSANPSNEFLAARKERSVVLSLKDLTKLMYGQRHC